MSKLLRYYRPGQVYFVTAVTHQRQPILVTQSDLLWAALEKVRMSRSVELIAWVVMPDHVHLIVDPRERNLSDLMKRIKLMFAYDYRRRLGLVRGQVWQRRFWDHIIRDQEDLNRHVDYIHYNPVKHGLATSPLEWKHTSIHEYRDVYAADWGVKEPIDTAGDFGE